MRVMISYKVKKDQVEPELQLLRAIYDELEATRPSGLRYATFQLGDEVSFVEIAETAAPGQFSDLAAFRAYRETLDERCDEPPVVTELREVGSFPVR